MPNQLVFSLDLLAFAAGLLFVCAYPHAGNSIRNPPVRVIAFIAATAVFVFIISDPSPIFWDFHQAYYAAGQAVLDSPSALSPLLGKGVSGFVNLPIVAYLFTPLAALDMWWGSALIFSLFGLASIAAAWLLLVKITGLEGRERWLLLFLFAASGPLHYSVKEGNTTHIVLLALVGGLYFLRRGQEIAAGALLGFAALIKLPLMLFGVYFVLRRIWGAVIGFVLVSALAGLLSLIVFDWDLNRQWFELCVLQFSRNPIGAFNDQSIPGFIARLFNGPEILREWKPHAAEPVQRLAASLLTGVIYISAVLACLRGPVAYDRAQASPVSSIKDLEYLLVIMLAIVAAPVSWTHYYLWMLIPFAFYLSPRSPFVMSVTARRLAWIGIILVSPAVIYLPFLNTTLMAFYAKFGVSHVLFGGLIWLVLVVWSRALAAHTELPTAGSSERSRAEARVRT